MDTPASGHRIQCLTYVDEFTKECLTITTAFAITGVQVTRILVSWLSGGWNENRSDLEFTCGTLDQWPFVHGRELRLIQPDRPTQNGYIILTGGLDEHLNAQLVQRYCSFQEKRLMIGGRIIMSVDHIQR